MAAFFGGVSFSWGQIHIPGEYFLDTQIQVYTKGSEGREAVQKYEVKRTDEILFWTENEVEVRADLNGGGQVIRRTSSPILLQRAKLIEEEGFALFVEGNGLHGVERFVIEPVYQGIGTVRMAATALDGEQSVRVWDETYRVIVEYLDITFSDSERVSRRQKQDSFKKTELSPMRESVEMVGTPSAPKKSAPKKKPVPEVIVIEELTLVPDIIEPVAPPPIETATADPCADMGPVISRAFPSFVSLQALALVSGGAITRLASSSGPCGGSRGPTRIENVMPESELDPCGGTGPFVGKALPNFSLNVIAIIPATEVTRLTASEDPCGGSSQTGGDETPTFQNKIKNPSEEKNSEEASPEFQSKVQYPSLQASPASEEEDGSEGDSENTSSEGPKQELLNLNLIGKRGFTNALLANENITRNVLGAGAELPVGGEMARLVLARVAETGGQSRASFDQSQNQRELQSLISQIPFAPDGTARDVIRDIVRTRINLQRPVVATVIERDLRRVKESIRVERPRVREIAQTDQVIRGDIVPTEVTRISTVERSAIERPTETTGGDATLRTRANAVSGPSLSVDPLFALTRSQGIAPSDTLASDPQPTR